MAVVRKNNVINLGANGDAVTGPLYIANVKCNSGATGGTIQLSVGGVVVYQQQLAVNSSPQSDYCIINIQGGDTLTATLPATCSVSLYLGDIT